MTLTITFATITVVALLLSGLLGSVESALAPISRARVAVSYTHLTLPTNREV